MFHVSTSSLLIPFVFCLSVSLFLYVDIMTISPAMQKILFVPMQQLRREKRPELTDSHHTDSSRSCTQHSQLCSSGSCSFPSVSSVSRSHRLYFWDIWCGSAWAKCCSAVMHATCAEPPGSCRTVWFAHIRPLPRAQPVFSNQVLCICWLGLLSGTLNSNTELRNNTIFILSSFQYMEAVNKVESFVHNSHSRK